MTTSLLPKQSPSPCSTKWPVRAARRNTSSQERVQRLVIDTADAELIKGKRILIIDDVISTGDSLRAMEELVTRAGGNIVGRMAVLAEGDAQKRDDIIVLGDLPLFNPDGTVKE